MSLSPRRRFLFKAVIVACALLLAEGLARVLYPWLSHPSGRYRVAILRGEVSLQPSRLPHPYLTYVNTPDYATEEGRPQHNSAGYRNPEFPATETGNVLRILALGGSTTYGTAVDRDDSWPRVLERELAAVAGAGKVRVVNGGLPAGTSAEILSHYAFRDRHRVRPAVVLLYIGLNDAMTLFTPGYDPEYTHYRRPWVRLEPRIYEKAWLQSGLVRVFYSWWLRGHSLGAEETYPVESMPAQEALENARHQEPLGLKHNFESLLQLMAADGAYPVLIPEGIAPREVYPYLEPRNAYAEPLHPALLTALAKGEQVLRELALRYGAGIIENDADIPLDCYVDHCHLNRRGEEIRGRFLAPKLLALLREKRPGLVGDPAQGAGTK